MKQAVSQIFITKIFDFGLRFAASVLIARYLGPEDKGVLTFATLVVAWLVTFGNLSLTDATVYFVGKRDFLPEQVAGSMFTFSVLAGLVYTGVTVWLLVAGVVDWPVGDRPVFFVLLSLVPLQLLLGNFTAILQGLSRFKAFNFFTLLGSGLFFVSVLAVVLMPENRLLAVAIAMVVAAGLTTVSLAAYLRRVAPWRAQLSVQFLKRGLSYGARCHLSVILETINRRFDQLVLGVLVDPIQLGWYSIAVTISELPQLLPDSIGTVLFPKVASDHAEGAVVTARVCRLTVVAILVIATAMVLLARPVIRIVYGEAFLPAAEPLLFLIPGILFLSISKILSKYICGVGRPHFIMWPTLASAVVTLGLIFPMVRIYGMDGAAITSSTAYAVAALVNLLLTVKLSAKRAMEFVVPQRIDLQTNPFLR